MAANTTYQHWKLNTDTDRILWLTLDRQGAPVNSLNREVITELGAIMEQIEQDKTLIGVIFTSGKSSGFIAGADIEQFTKLKDLNEAYNLIRQAQIIFNKLEALQIPTVAMIEGFCLGGGLELVLACRYRVAEDGPKTILGAPEVKLGIHPGWGGTIRLPQLVGVLAAMDLNLSGRTINARAAAKIGLVDDVVPKRHLQRAARFYVLNKPPKHQPSKLQMLLNHKLIRPLLAKKFNLELAKKVAKEHYPAPYAIVENWLKDGAVGEAAMINEAKSIANLFMTDTSQNLVRVFFLQSRMKGLAKDTKFKIEHVHVIGAGTMGGDIAAWCALRGFHVTLQDRAPEFIAPAIKRAYDLFQKKLKLPRLVQTAMDRLMPDPQGIGVSKADVVIEAVSENLEIKHAIYQAVEPQLKPNAILATNTSSLPLDELSKVLKQPQRLVGIHFFNPVPLMQLVEVVEGPNSDAKIIENAMAFVRAIDRLPLLVKSSPGFLVNRVLMPYLMEGITLLEEGVPAPLIDRASVKFGMPMGPIELADIVGLDVCLSVADIFAKHFGVKVPERLKDMVTTGELGKKSSKGFYNWQQGKAVKPPVVDADKANTIPMEDITDRLILSMINEAVACLREGIVADADLVDAGMIFGTGFAPFRGGPIQYAKTRGVSLVKQRLEELQAKYGARFQPDIYWETLIAESMPKTEIVNPLKTENILASSTDSITG